MNIVDLTLTHIHIDVLKQVQHLLNTSPDAYDIDYTLKDAWFEALNPMVEPLLSSTQSTLEADFWLAVAHEAELEDFRARFDGLSGYIREAAEFVRDGMKEQVLRELLEDMDSALSDAVYHIEVEMVRHNPNIGPNGPVSSGCSVVNVRPVIASEDIGYQIFPDLEVAIGDHPKHDDIFYVLWKDITFEIMVEWDED